MSRKGVDTTKTKKKKLLIAVFLFLLPVPVFLLYTAGYYHAADTAVPALESDSVRVERTTYGWFFDGSGDDCALVFYPGAKVEETAYAPLLHSLAVQGVDAFLVKMPFHLAVFGMNAADGILARYEYEYRFIGGHSLGGAVAANYASAHDLDGVILLASYPTRTLDEPMLILYGSEDGVLNRGRLEAAPQFGTVEEIEIAGGNHAGFGEYGAQKGDGPAVITSEEQQEAAAELILQWLSDRRQR